ncbi:hypothetical protein CAG61_10770 [Vibrio sp. V34_P3A8T189]|nr:hypothetical protein [Vibrio sp. V34_P3A8T189]
MPFFDKWVTGPASISVSKVNQWVAVFVLFCWVSLVGFSLYKSILSKYFLISGDIIEYAHYVVITFAAICCYLLLFAAICCLLMVGFGRTHKRAQNPIVIGRYVKIKE